MQLNKKTTFALLMSFFLIIIDRFFKSFIVHYSFVDISIIPSYAGISLYKNSALAFSIPIQWTWLFSIFVIILLVCVLFIIARSYLTRHYKYLFYFTLIFLGGASNLYDRIMYSGVIDYFYIYPFSYFNIADLMIGAGILFLIVKYKHG